MPVFGYLHSKKVFSTLKWNVLAHVFCHRGVVEFKILRAAKRAHRMIATLDLKRADVTLSGDLFGLALWDKALEGRGA